MLTEEQLSRARAARRRPRGTVPRVLYVGRLSAAKNIDILLEAVAAAAARGVVLHTTIVGDGPKRADLEAQCARLGLTGQVEFAGGVQPDRVLDYFEQADILALVSESEGWPKAIAEAMAFGLICIGSNRGLVPQMLGEGRGITVTPRDPAALTEVLLAIAAAPEQYGAMRLRAGKWADEYSLEGLRTALYSLHKERWGVSLKAISPATSVNS
jgi:glycosyltransferase involved in cell wall biosynthesis